MATKAVAARWLVLACVVLMAAACTSGDEGLLGGGGAGAESWPALEPGDAMPPRLRAAVLAAREAASDPRYAFTETAAALTAESPAAGMSVRVEGGVVEVSAADGGWSFGMELTGIGRGDAAAPAPTVQAVGREQNRAWFRRGGVEEWYLNGPRGLEQGWTLAEAPAGEGALTLTLAFAGVRPEPAGQGVALHGAGGIVVAHYTDAFVRAADGALLASSMDVDGADVRLRIEDGGALYPVEVDPLVWVQQDKLLASDGAENDGFGSASISGNTALIGAYLDDDNGLDSGSVYVFVRFGGTWTQQQKLLPLDGETGDAFGYPVSVSGDTALVGAVGDDDNGSGSGSAYAFVRSGVTWTQQQKLLPLDGEMGDAFGNSVSVSGDTALVGAYADDDNGTNAGSVYAFVRSGGVWTQQQKILPLDGATNDLFGQSVSLSGDSALVGSPLDDDNGSGSGSAYVLVRSGGIWTQQEKLVPLDAATDDSFGWSVSISGDSALVGARGNDDNGSDSGSAYAFVRSGVTWTQQQKLLPLDGAAGDLFGQHVSLSGDIALVGAEGDDSIGSGSGSAYAFVRSGVTWTQHQKLLPLDGAAYDSFGASTSASGDTALVGAYGDDDNGSNSGSAYVLVLKSGVGDLCSDANECASAYCVDGLCCDSLCGGGLPDDCVACDLAGTEGTCSNIPTASACGDGTDSACDHPDSCDGAGSCLVNYTVAGSACGSSFEGECDHADSCDGSGSCETHVEPGGTPCGDQGVVCHSDDSCDATGNCVDHGFEAEGTPCGDVGSECRFGGACTASGSCLDGGVRPEGTPCGDPAATECTAPDTCDATGTCAPNHLPSDTPCGSMPCEPPTTCDGQGVCVDPCPDGTYCEGSECFPLRPNGEGCGRDDECQSGSCSQGMCCSMPCGGGCGRCDLPGSVGTCVLSPAGEICRAAVDPGCDADELCDGVTATCPEDAISADGTSCSSGSCKGGFCQRSDEAAEEDGGCGCALPGGTAGRWWVALFLAAPPLARRRRKAA